MGEPLAVTQGTFADFKIIKGRKVAQLVIEVPIETADAALKALGGVPRADQEVWVAIARMTAKGAQASSPEPEEPKKQSLTQQAGILCSDTLFQAFVRDLGYPVGATKAAEDAASAVRVECAVKSRAEFDTDPAAGQRWRELHGAYLVWKSTA